MAAVRSGECCAPFRVRPGHLAGGRVLDGSQVLHNSVEDVHVPFRNH